MFEILSYHPIFFFVSSESLKINIALEKKFIFYFSVNILLHFVKNNMIFYNYEILGCFNF